MDLPSRLLTRRIPPPWAVAVAFAVGAAAIVLVAMAGKLGTAARSVSPGARPTTPAAHTSARRKRRRPNIVVVMTDDQALSQTRYMPNVQRLLARAGTTFSNFYASYPLCCPSRATFLTGQYAHNDGVRENGGNRGGF